MKKAYLIATYRKILDSEKFASYAEIAASAMVKAGGKILARGMPNETFEDGLKERTVVIEFESVEAAVSAYRSKPYANALKVLDGGAVRDMRVVESIE